MVTEQKSVQIQEIVTLDVETLVSDGRALGRLSGLAVFVAGALPGQQIEARILRLKKRMAEAELIRVLQKAPEEQAPPCPHAEQCGGCPWQSLPYTHQLTWKTTLVRDALERVGKQKKPPLLEALPSPNIWHYRNKMEFAFGPSAEGTILGLRARSSHAVVRVPECQLQSPRAPRLAELVAGLLKPEPKLLARGRFLVVREPQAGGCFAELILSPASETAAQGAALGKRLGEALHAVFPELSGFTLSIRKAQTDVAYGETTLYSETSLRETIGGVSLELGHAAFFQVNTPAADLLYAEAGRFCALDTYKAPVVWDVYSGIGSIGFSLYPHMPHGRLTGIEAVSPAVDCARNNAQRLGFTKYRAEAGDAAHLLKRLVQQEHPDVVIVDPPRAGLDPEVIQSLLKAAPERLVYVSCNPATLARDIERLAPAYRLTAIRPVDLFPQTPHIETVSLLTRA